VLRRPLSTRRNWDSKDVVHQMLKLDKHHLLKTLQVSASRMGIWRTSGKTFSSRSHETARLMGY
jgi:hypothetical protein